MKDDGVHLQFYMKNSYGKVGIGGVLTEDGLSYMIDAPDMKRMDMISPSIDDLIDPVSGEANTCLSTTMFPDYLGRRVLVAVFRNGLGGMKRTSLKCVHRLRTLNTTEYLHLGPTNM